MSDVQSTLKRVIFYGVFAAVFVIYTLIVFGDAISPDFNLSGRVMSAINEMAPLILNELSVPGELAPAVLGGLIALNAPRRASINQLIAILLLSGLTWALYLHLQVYVNQDHAAISLGLANVQNSNIPDAQKVISSFASSVRNFGAITFAAVIGLRLNDGDRNRRATDKVKDGINGDGGNGNAELKSAGNAANDLLDKQNNGGEG